MNLTPFWRRNGDPEAYASRMINPTSQRLCFAYLKIRTLGIECKHPGTVPALSPIACAQAEELPCVPVNTRRRSLDTDSDCSPAKELTIFPDKRMLFPRKEFCNACKPTLRSSSRYACRCPDASDSTRSRIGDRQPLL